MNKKGAELTVNLLILMALGIIVLFLVSSYLFRGSKKAETGLFDCESKKGAACESKDICTKDGGVVISTLKCAAPQICCYKFK